MSEQKFTPGPWKSREWPIDHERLITGGDGLLVARVCRCENGKPLQDLNIANAHLIAAAPELFEALELMLKLHDSNGGDPHGLTAEQQSNGIRGVRAALSKAKGQQ